ncbi:NACHT domain-containing protein [Saccharothrix syringae]|uniref:NACHT N-terminal Helical domain-containing protein n=1 Tax=Saccharothrix syringae TaxID=103733 RepID=A0A5Q0H6T8_SACSY|nr:hypothetical protein [Saccharothrix syringae]QFZ21654.1 hypothetical protein EKG83_33470 [Saccharothrix syringae]
MTRTHSYADAVRLLGKSESRVVAALDRIVGGALLSGVAMGLSDLMGWFDAKVDFVRLSHELLVKAGERRSGLSRYDSTERAEAAHAVVVVVAFFDAVEALSLPVTWREVDLDRVRQLGVVGLTGLFAGELPLPSASRPYEGVLRDLRSRYRGAGAEFAELVRASAVWDRLDETRRSRVEEALGSVGEAAVRRYEELLRELAGAYPELRFWLQVRDGAATRTALAGLERSLAGLLVGRSPDARRAELARKYRALLDRPLIEQGVGLPGLRVPTVGRAYVDPDFQVVPHEPGHQPSVLSWWADQPVRDDLYHYLTGYLGSSQAVRTPLLVLADPGAGKSVFTKVLAARLPPSDFLAVRVELRGTPTDADLVDQVQHGLRAALKEDVGWAEFARSAGDALPVVLLDGFDELLQATGVGQTRYLVKVGQFQRDRAEAGRPVAVVVTSRMSVCGGVHIPEGGDVLRLVPFTEPQVRAWLDGWNTANDDYFRQAGRAPLTPEVVLRYPDLATQPLLLLMLALYDAAGNALQRAEGRIDEADLYERLLTVFARREVTKDDEDRTEADLAEDVETELERLAVVAFAMFNRGAQWVGEADLGDDLAGLLGAERVDRRSGTRSPLTPGEAVLGRFFFVQRSQAVRGEHTLRTYEFLHATFGEYLVARFTWRVLTDLHAVDGTRPRRLAGAPLDDEELFSLLSFAPLSARRPVLLFLRDFAGAAEDVDALAALVRRLFVVSLRGAPRPETAYRPVYRAASARQAVYSLNLVLLGAVLAGRVHSGAFGIPDWSRLAAFWKSQLSAGEWLAVRQSFGVRWLGDGQVELRFGADQDVPPVDLRKVDPPPDLTGIAADAHLTADPVLNHLRYAVEPVLAAGTPLSFARMMVDLGFAPVADRPARDGWYLAAADFAPDVVLDQVAGDPLVPAGVLRALADTALGVRAAFWAQLYDRLGKGGPDGELLAVVGECWEDLTGVMLDARASVLDAWLRLHEAGYRLLDDHDYPDLAGLVDRLDLDALRVERPDLLARLERLPSTGEVLVPVALDGPVAAPQPVPRPGTPRLESRREQLSQLDELLARGKLSADAYRARRDRLLRRGQWDLPGLDPRSPAED